MRGLSREQPASYRLSVGTEDRQQRAGFVSRPAPSPAVARLEDADLRDHGYVMTLTRVWGHQPEIKEGLFGLLARAAAAAGLTLRQRGVLVSACASASGDAYCSLAWGSRLAAEVGPAAAAAVLRGDDSALAPEDRALARWARRVAVDPNGATEDDVAALRAAGWDDAGIVALTAFVALRGAFSAVNDALGAHPDRELADAAPDEVLEAVVWGRPVARPPA